MAHHEERRSFWRRVVDAVTRRWRHDVVVTSPPATEEDVRRVEELDKQYGWERFREKP